MEWRNGRRVRVRTHLSEVLVLANETGRRISAILWLRFHDLRLAPTQATPFGAISWPAETDKEGRRWEAVPVTRRARETLDRILRERPGIGEAPLFPYSPPLAILRGLWTAI